MENEKKDEDKIKNILDSTKTISIQKVLRDGRTKMGGWINARLNTRHLSIGRKNDSPITEGQDGEQVTIDLESNTSGADSSTPQAPKS